MKISENTINTLKSFSVINQSIMVRPGSKISTMSPGETIIASAKVEEDFPTQFCIYELPRFLGVVSLFENPDFDFTDSSVTIRSGKKKTSITYAAPSMIVTPPAGDINFPDPEVEFNLAGTDLSNILKAATVMQLPEVAITGKDGNIFLEAIDNKNPTADTYSITVGETNKVFKMIFKIENLKLINSDYHVSVSSRGLSRFSNDKLTYFVVTEATSSYEG